MMNAMTMSSHCSGCGSIELALRFIAAACSGHGFPFQLRTSSCCAHPLVESALIAWLLILNVLGQLAIGILPVLVIKLLSI